MTQLYHRVNVTTEFLQILKEYTRRAKENEAKKNGVRKIPITKAMVCRNIINDMQRTKLI